MVFFIWLGYSVVSTCSWPGTAVENPLPPYLVRRECHVLGCRFVTIEKYWVESLSLKSTCLVGLLFGLVAIQLFALPLYQMTPSSTSPPQTQLRCHTPSSKSLTTPGFVFTRLHSQPC